MYYYYLRICIILHSRNVMKSLNSLKNNDLFSERFSCFAHSRLTVRSILLFNQSAVCHSKHTYQVQIIGLILISVNIIYVYKEVLIVEFMEYFHVVSCVAFFNQKYLKIIAKQIFRAKNEAEHL